MFDELITWIRAWSDNNCYIYLFNFRGGGYLRLQITCKFLFIVPLIILIPFTLLDMLLFSYCVITV